MKFQECEAKIIKIVKAVVKGVTGIAHHHVWEDVAQIVRLKLYALEEEGQFPENGKYLSAVIRNTAISALKKRGLHDKDLNFGYEQFGIGRI